MLLLSRGEGKPSESEGEGESPAAGSSQEGRIIALTTRTALAVVRAHWLAAMNS